MSAPYSEPTSCAEHLYNLYHDFRGVIIVIPTCIFFTKSTAGVVPYFALVSSASIVPSCACLERQLDGETRPEYDIRPSTRSMRHFGSY